MTEEQKNYLKSFAKSERLFGTVRDFVLDFGTINTDCTDAELGARYKAREELKKEIERKFKTMRFLVDESE